MSVTASTVLLGLAMKLSKGNNNPSLYLIPLLLVIPAWWVFFDKATTITRIVGYYKILESMHINENKYNYYGWEKSLEIFRLNQETGNLIWPEYEKNRTWKNMFSIIFFRTTHRYWVLNYYVYFGLSLVSLSMYFKTASELFTMAGILGISFVLLSALWNFRMTWHLIYGKYSYRANTYFWDRILRHILINL
jgi:hypothetical protein